MQKENNKQDISEYLAENEAVFSNLDEEAYDLIAAMTDSDELRYVKKECKTESEGVNMCQAIKEMIEDGRCEGEELAIRVMKLKLQGMSAKEIAKKSGIQQEKVDEILRKFAA